MVCGKNIFGIELSFELFFTYKIIKIPIWCGVPEQPNISSLLLMIEVVIMSKKRTTPTQGISNDFDLIFEPQLLINTSTNQLIIELLKL